MPQDRDIIFRLRSNADVTYEALKGKFERNSGIWDSVKRLAPSCELRPRYSKLKDGDTKDLNFVIEKARERSFMGWGTHQSITIESFSKSFVLHCPQGGNLQEILNKLLSWEHTERAHIAYAVTGPAAVHYTGNPDSFRQEYLQPAPSGIDAFYAWQQPGGDGAGQDFVDLEGGWRLDHEDLLGVLTGTNPLFGINNIANNIVDVAHGTNVLGVVCAEDNAKGGIGIVPHLNGVNVVSHNMTSVNLPDAILTSALHLLRGGMGGVLLIEAQLGHPPFPVEIDVDVYEAILTATNAGIAVVEAAGNGNQSLTGLLPDSGAIMVASGWRPPCSGGTSCPWERRGDSNYGERINCFAWGDNVFTTHSTPLEPTTAYQGNFSGTSSASAMIAGAALAVQGMATNIRGHALNPRHLRALLGSTQMDTLGSNTRPNSSTPWIGVMPNLKVIRQWL